MKILSLLYFYISFISLVFGLSELNSSNNADGYYQSVTSWNDLPIIATDININGYKMQVLIEKCINCHIHHDTLILTNSTSPYVCIALVEGKLKYMKDNMNNYYGIFHYTDTKISPDDCEFNSISELQRVSHMKDYIFTAKRNEITKIHNKTLLEKYDSLCDVFECGNKVESCYSEKVILTGGYDSLVQEVCSGLELPMPLWSIILVFVIFSLIIVFVTYIIIITTYERTCKKRKEIKPTEYRSLV